MILSFSAVQSELFTAICSIISSKNSSKKLQIYLILVC
jgi:hypothetical protein